MKALFVSPAGAAYGSERSMLALLRARQFEAEVVCPGGGVLEHELRQLGIRVYPLEFGKYSVKQNPLWHLGFYCRLRKILGESRPDVLVINLDGNTPLVTIAAVRTGIPIIRFCRFEFKPPARWLDRWCWLQATAIICPSELVKQQVLAWLPPERNSRVYRLYDPYAGHAATPREVAAFREEFQLSDAKVIGCIGRLHRGKRIETAIQALAEVRKRVSNARLLVIGGAGSADEMAYQDELQRLAVDLGVGEAVVFTGYRQTEFMPAAIAALDICILTSESESFGMVLMEAWAQGVPTVASNIGGCSEIAQASKGGHLAPVDDAGAFASQLLALISDPQAARTMGRKGQAWVRESCASADYASKFYSALRACNSSAL
jgi:glycosyltransferase involved in cell wall biosynthesis